MLTDFLAHQSGKLVVHRMSWTCSNNPSLNRTADKGHIADDIKQFVTGTFIVPYQRLVLDIPQVGSVHMRYSQHISQLVKILLRHLALVDHDGVV